MVDKVSICNMALSNIGQKPILSLDQAGPSANLCKLRYDEARLQALSSCLWGFASGWKAGVAVAADPKPGWDYVFKYPNDALRVFEIQRETPSDPAIPFEVTDAMTGGGKWIHTNDSEPVFIYTRDKVDVTNFDWEFTVALSWLLASKIAMPLTKSQTILDRCEKQWLSHRVDAKARTRNEGAQDQDQLASYQKARH